MSPPPRYSVGDRFGRVTLVERLHKDATRKYRWLARCDCGGDFTLHAESLGAGKTRSCGCLQKELLAERVRTHGQGSNGNRSVEYKTWLRIKARCGNPAHKDYPKYGARGIAVCERWAASFEAFFADMGRRPGRKHSIGRIDNDGPYAPENCRWETADIQQQNTRAVRHVTVDGTAMSASAAERLLDIPRRKIALTVFKKKISHQEALELILQGQRQ